MLDEGLPDVKGDLAVTAGFICLVLDVHLVGSPRFGFGSGAWGIASCMEFTGSCLGINFWGWVSPPNSGY